MPDYRPRCFTSYAHADADFVEPILGRLEAAGVDTWRDVDDLAPGEVWDRAISRAINDSDAAIVFVGARGLTQYQEGELTLALSRQCLTVPALLPGYPDPAPPGRLAEFQAVDYRGGSDPTDRVIAALFAARAVRAAIR